MIFIFLHETLHLYCTKYEIPAGDFYNRYCQDAGLHDSYMNARYAIWREVVADIMADSILSEYSSFSLFKLEDKLNRLYQLVISKLPNSKKNMSLIIVYVMISKEVCGETEWNVEIFGWTTVLVDGKVADLKGNTVSSIADFKSLRELYMMD